MTHFTLSPHPDHSPQDVRGVSVSMSTESDLVTLVYRVDGAARMVVPGPNDPTRADELWRTTCFELFLLFDDDERYVEFNFSPSTRWAAYAFDGYRDGMEDLSLRVAPKIDRLEDGVRATIDRADLPHGELRMALTAVIEEEGGVKSFWSLSHPPGAPDFHHGACFVARLPAPGQA